MFIILLGTIITFLTFFNSKNLTVLKSLKTISSISFLLKSKDKFKLNLSLPFNEIG